MKPQVTSKQFLTVMRVIHLALILGVVMFGIVSILINKEYFVVRKYTSDEAPFYIIAVVLAASGWYGGKWFFNQRIKLIERQLPLYQKLLKYQEAIIIQMALLEGPALFSVVISIILNNSLSLFLVLFLVLFMVTLKPSVERITEILQLDYEDKKRLETPDFVLEPGNQP